MLRCTSDPIWRPPLIPNKKHDYTRNQIDIRNVVAMVGDGMAYLVNAKHIGNQRRRTMFDDSRFHHIVSGERFQKLESFANDSSVVRVNALKNQLVNRLPIQSTLIVTIPSSTNFKPPASSTTRQYSFRTVNDAMVIMRSACRFWLSLNSYEREKKTT